jgi:hypothetical protein
MCHGRILGKAGVQKADNRQEKKYRLGSKKQSTALRAQKKHVDTVFPFPASPRVS